MSIKFGPCPGLRINKVSSQALMGDSFYEEIMKDLDALPANVQGWIKGMQETFNEIMRTMPNALRHVPDPLKTKEMCIRTVEENHGS